MENPWKDKYLAEAAKHDETVRKLAALTSHLNQVHEELGGTDTVLTLEAAQYVMARLAALTSHINQVHEACAKCGGSGYAIDTERSGVGRLVGKKCDCGCFAYITNATSATTEE